MGVIPYETITPSGQKKTMYMVVVEAINKYTRERVQKKRRGIPSEPKAQRIYRELWTMCREERPDDANVENWGVLLNKYTEHLSKKIRSSDCPMGFSPQVVRSKRSRIDKLRVWDEKHLELITPHFVSDYLDRMEIEGASRSITFHLHKEVKCIFSFALDLGAIKSNPFAGAKGRKLPKKRKEALTHDEANRLIACAKRENHPYYYIWLLTLALGLRRSELAGLKWLDIDFDQRLIYLRRQLIPREGIVNLLKDREERVVAIPLHIIPVLKELKLKSPSDFVISIKSHYWASGNQSEVLRAFCRQIGIKEVTHHQLRATHITLALVDGIPLGIVKENVGHAKLSTTDVYFRSAGINMKGQTDKLNLVVPQDTEGEVINFKTKS